MEGLNWTVPIFYSLETSSSSFTERASSYKKKKQNGGSEDSSPHKILIFDQALTVSQALDFIKQAFGVCCEKDKFEREELEEYGLFLWKERAGKGIWLQDGEQTLSSCDISWQVLVPTFPSSYTCVTHLMQPSLHVRIVLSFEGAPVQWSSLWHLQSFLCLSSLIYKMAKRFCI